ncbi:HNH endonuclease [Gracilimonas amylolytica]|uniref:HNH endonuclease n=1 Tax=Gracilimonas amylolytica TaxID=1749045 RepID=UPI000CD8C8DA|nr:HNH endonuclease [Gracilimonas amylolytica]
MKFYIGVTDDDWFHFLAQHQPDEVNFWRPRDKSDFKVIQEGAPFLFKLHSPNNYIVGGGFFVRHLFLPLSLTWDAFGIKNGAATYDGFRQSIMKFREGEGLNPTIGSTILTEPFFFDRKDWIPIPKNWSKNIVKGKSYSTEESIGANVWDQVQERLGDLDRREGELVINEPGVQYGKMIEIRSRIGQSAFRAMVTDAYKYRCAITKEKTLPVLEAAHIKPYSNSGPNLTKNGLLLRSDMHILFDKGYMTVTDDHRVEVSQRIREEYENGKEYYAYHGKQLQNLPEHNLDQPSADYLQWHQQEIYLG